MRVLWITNAVFPEVSFSLTGQRKSFTGTGGWMQAAANHLVVSGGIELCIAGVSDEVNTLYRYQGESVLYFLIPQGKGNIHINKDFIPYWKAVNDVFRPDIVHIHGTELPHSYTFLQAVPDANAVVSIQGLMSHICKVYSAGMSKMDLLRSVTIRDIGLDILRPRQMCGTLCSVKRNFTIRGSIEPLIYQKVSNVIGRTSWDRSNVLSINPDLRYFCCNETLRPVFYEGKWEYDRCVPHTIFLSQATYPFKGLHMVLRALETVLRKYPDAKVLVAGNTRFSPSSFKEHLLQDGYSKFIRRLMKNLGIGDGSVVSLGPLDAEGMKQQYLSCNVFVSASAIENSPNSLCEAQILGVPCIATDAGGTRDMIPDERCGRIYDYYDTEKLARLIIETFESSPIFDGAEEIRVARIRHDAKRNTSRLMEIYSDLMKGK